MRSAQAAVLVVALSMLALAHPSPSSASDEKTAPAAGGTRIHVSFKLDPRLSGPTYGGERWVSPPTYTGASAQDVVEARAEALDAKGRPLDLPLRWIPEDPAMVSVTPGEGHQVKIAVKRAGESKVKLASTTLSRELLVKARPIGKLIQVEIVQLAPEGK